MNLNTRLRMLEDHPDFKALPEEVKVRARELTIKQFYESGVNDDGNYPAHMLFKRLKESSPWIKDPKWSDKLAIIQEILEFLEKFPVGDLRVTEPKLLTLLTLGVKFNRSLSSLEIDDLQMKFNTWIDPDGEVAMIDLF